MPRRKRDEAVAERAQQLLAERGQRRPRGRRGAEAAVQDQTEPKRATRAQRERKDLSAGRQAERKPRVHQDLLTIAYRGPLASKFREMAEQHGMSLAKLLQDAMLTYEQSIAGGYQPGTTLEGWEEEQRQAAGEI